MLTPHVRRPPLGTMAVVVPPGDHTVVLAFSSTPRRTAATAVSFASLGLLLALTVLRRDRTMEARRPA